MSISAVRSFRTSLEKSRQILGYTKICAPAIILLVFLAAFITHGIVTAPPSDDVEVHAKLGPGGRPLPKRRQSSQQVKQAAKVRDFSPSVKLLFNWLGVFALMTFAANAVLIILQSIIYFRDQWWPGQAAVVSARPFLHSPCAAVSDRSFPDLRGSIILCLGHNLNLTN